MRTQGKEPQVNILFLQNKVVTDKVYENIQRIGSSPAKGIAE